MTAWSETSTISRRATYRYRPEGLSHLRSAPSVRRGSTAASRQQCRPARKSPCRPGFSLAYLVDVEQRQPTIGRVAPGGRSSSTLSSDPVEATVIDPFAAEPGGRDVAPYLFPQFTERSARRSSAPGDRPLTQTSPKLRTEAPTGCSSRSRWMTVAPERTANTACIVPRMPPPTTTTRREVRRLIPGARRPSGFVAQAHGSVDSAPFPGSSPRHFAQTAFQYVDGQIQVLPGYRKAAKASARFPC